VDRILDELWSVGIITTLCFFKDLTLMEQNKATKYNGEQDKHKELTSDK